MCNPAAALMGAQMAIGAMSAKAEYDAQSERADQINDANATNRQNSIYAMQEEYRQTQRRQSQERDSAAEKVSQRQTQAQKETASARVAAGEAGISGISVESLYRDISQVSLNDQSNINQGADWNVEQLSSQMSGIRTKTQSRINSAPTAAGPSPWTTALKIGNNTVGAYDGHVRRTGKDPLFGGD